MIKNLKLGLVAPILFVALIGLTGIVEFLVLGEEWCVTILTILMLITFFVGFVMVYLNKRWKITAMIVLCLMLEVWFAKMAIVSIIWHVEGFV